MWLLAACPLRAYLARQSYFEYLYLPICIKCTQLAKMKKKNSPFGNGQFYLLVLWPSSAKLPKLYFLADFPHCDMRNIGIASWCPTERLEFLFKIFESFCQTFALFKYLPNLLLLSIDIHSLVWELKAMQWVCININRWHRAMNRLSFQTH